MLADCNTILIITAALVAAPLAVGLLLGIDRRLTARMQNRQGPSILQSFYDFLKLFCLKKTAAINKPQIFFLILYLIFSILIFTFFILGKNLLLVCFLSAAASVFLVLSVLSIKGPYSHIAGYREIIQVFCCESILLLAAVSIYFCAKSFNIAEIYGKKPLLLSLPFVLLSLFAVLIIKARKSPFDIAACEHAHQELVRGIYTDFAGPYLGLLMLGHWYELAFILGFISLFWFNPWYLGIALSLGCYFFALLIDNIYSRTNWFSLIKISGISWILILLNIFVFQIFK